MMPAWYVRMNKRERMLSMIVGGVVFALINLFLWNWVLGAIGRSRTELTQAKLMRKEQEIFMKERDLWTQREQWLQQHQPAFNGAGEASTLLEQQLNALQIQLDEALDHIEVFEAQQAQPEAIEEEPQEIQGVSGLDTESEAPMPPPQGAHSPASSKSSVNDLDDF